MPSHLFPHPRKSLMDGLRGRPNAHKTCCKSDEVVQGGTATRAIEGIWSIVIRSSARQRVKTHGSDMRKLAVAVLILVALADAALARHRHRWREAVPDQAVEQAEAQRDRRGLVPRTGSYRAARPRRIGADTSLRTETRDLLSIQPPRLRAAGISIGRKSLLPTGGVNVFGAQARQTHCVWV